MKTERINFVLGLLLSCLVSTRAETLTPNPDRLYFMAFLNTKDVGPIVIEVPPANDGGSMNANIVNIWQEPSEDAGLLGVDKGKGVKLLMLPPEYKEKVPDGYEALQPLAPKWKRTRTAR